MGKDQLPVPDRRHGHIRDSDDDATALLGVMDRIFKFPMSSRTLFRAAIQPYGPTVSRQSSPRNRSIVCSLYLAISKANIQRFRNVE